MFKLRISCGKRYFQPANDVMQSAFVEKGIPLGDVNGASEDQGFWERIQVFQAKGWRMGSYRFDIGTFGVGNQMFSWLFFKVLCRACFGPAGHHRAPLLPGHKDRVRG